MLTTTHNAIVADVPLLVAMMHEFYAEANYPLDEQWAAASFSTLLHHSSYGGVVLVFADGAPAGYAVLTVHFSMEHGGLAASIDDLFVRPSYRRQGLGRAALDALLAECRWRQVLAVAVEVGHDNTAAQALYHRIGLRQRDDKRLIYVAQLDAM